jgi:hypothetical protein
MGSASSCLVSVLDSRDAAHIHARQFDAGLGIAYAQFFETSDLQHSLTLKTYMV